MRAVPDFIAIAPEEALPLTCTRLGTCCHGKDVRLNPFELARLALARGESVRNLRDRDAIGGVRLRFSGPPGWRGLPACSQYQSGTGCRAHAGRPLACRLYPLGRVRVVRENAGISTSSYGYQGPEFPCLAGCPEVRALPQLRLADYLAQQDVAEGEAAQDAYAELAQDLAEAAFAIVFDSGLAQRPRERQAVIAAWRAAAACTAEQRAQQLATWFDRLTAPELRADLPGADFAAAHHALLREALQSSFARLADPLALIAASATCFAMALLIAEGDGLDHVALGSVWIAAAQRR